VTACLVAAEHELMLPPKVLPTALFVALVLAASLYGLAASGHFPRSAKAPAPGVGAPVLFGSIVVVLACAVAGITAALPVVPWYVAVIGGGSAILAAPLVLATVPRPFCRRTRHVGSIRHNLCRNRPTSDLERQRFLR